MHNSDKEERPWQAKSTSTKKADNADNTETSRSEGQHESGLCKKEAAAKAKEQARIKREEDKKRKAEELEAKEQRCSVSDSAEPGQPVVGPCPCRSVSSGDHVHAWWALLCQIAQFQPVHETYLGATLNVMVEDLCC